MLFIKSKYRQFQRDLSNLNDRQRLLAYSSIHDAKFNIKAAISAYTHYKELTTDASGKIASLLWWTNAYEAKKALEVALEKAIDNVNTIKKILHNPLSRASSESKLYYKKELEEEDNQLPVVKLEDELEPEAPTNPDPIFTGRRFNH